MILRLPFPHKLLWPNGSRGHPRAVAGQKRKHKQWAHTAVFAAREARAHLLQQPFAAQGQIGLHIIVHAKPRGPLPDRDNVVAAVKSYQDGISLALGIDDKHFATPTVEFAPVRSGEFVIHVGGVAA